jgi:hypothetical protein
VYDPFGVVTVLNASWSTLSSSAYNWVYGFQKRAEQYFELSKSFSENERFQKICILLEENDQKLETLPVHEKQEFIGFYENIALLMNTGLLRKAVAHYMFAYYAIRCWDSKYFWVGLN